MRSSLMSIALLSAAICIAPIEICLQRRERRSFGSASHLRAKSFASSRLVGVIALDPGRLRFQIEVSIALGACAGTRLSPKRPFDEREGGLACGVHVGRVAM